MTEDASGLERRVASYTEPATALIESGRAILRSSPNITARELLDRMEQLVDMTREVVTNAAQRAVCRHCEQEIVVVGQRWVHNDPDLSRGCRAASFREDHGWNDSLNRNSKAQPR